MTAKQEIEAKFALPQGKDSLEIADAVVGAASKKSWVLKRTNFETLHFVYYDTPQMDLYTEGATLRKITGYLPVSKPEAKFRYDYKTGSLENRLETTRWSRFDWSPEKIIKKLALQEKYAKVQEVVETDALYLKLYFQRWLTKVEVSLDKIFTGEKFCFAELEIELLRGSERRYKKLVHFLQEKMDLTTVTQQKYGRVMEIKMGDGRR